MDLALVALVLVGYAAVHVVVLVSLCHRLDGLREDIAKVHRAVLESRKAAVVFRPANPTT